MREILFRGERIDNGKWINGYLLEQNMPEYHCYIVASFIAEQDNRHTDILEFSIYEVLPETVGQFTGLTDKNGKRIFEGDICKFKHLGDANVGQIVFNYSTATFVMCFSIIVGAYGEKAVRRMLLSVFDDIKIIGNINDSPELLGEEDT